MFHPAVTVEATNTTSCVGRMWETTAKTAGSSTEVLRSFQLDLLCLSGLIRSFVRLQMSEVFHLQQNRCSSPPRDDKENQDTGVFALWPLISWSSSSFLSLILRSITVWQDTDLAFLSALRWISTSSIQAGATLSETLHANLKMVLLWNYKIHKKKQPEHWQHCNLTWWCTSEFEKNRRSAAALRRTKLSYPVRGFSERLHPSGWSPLIISLHNKTSYNY